MVDTATQMSIFDYISGSPECGDCVFCENGECSHIKGQDFGCMYGSFRIPWSEAVCPECGQKLLIHQVRMGGDFAVCRKCDRHILFSNRGNRKTAFQLWKTGVNRK